MVNVPPGMAVPWPAVGKNYSSHRAQNAVEMILSLFGCVILGVGVVPRQVAELRAKLPGMQNVHCLGGVLCRLLEGDFESQDAAHQKHQSSVKSLGFGDRSIPFLFSAAKKMGIVPL
jgi:hypothetical protein